MNVSFSFLTTDGIEVLQLYAALKGTSNPLQSLVLNHYHFT